MVHKDINGIEGLLNMSYNNQKTAVSYLVKNTLNCSLIKDLLIQLYPDIDANFQSRELNIWLKANCFTVKQGKLEVLSSDGYMVIDLSNNQIVN